MAFQRRMGRTIADPLARIALALLLSAIVPGSSALAASLTYVSQSGTVSASGSTPNLGSGSQSMPIAGLADVHVIAQVANGTPPEFYAARAELQTTLGATLLNVAGQATATAAPVAPCCEVSFANSSALVTLRFDLDEAAPIRVGPASYPYSVDYTALRFLDLGRQVTWNQYGSWSAFCNPFDPADPLCGEIIKAVSEPTGGILPSGRYELVYSLFALQPHGSCASGCLSARGTMRFAIVPEPGTGVLTMTGLLGLLCRPRWHRRAA